MKLKNEDQVKNCNKNECRIVGACTILGHYKPPCACSSTIEQLKQEKHEIALYVKELRKQIETNGLLTDIEYNLKRIEHLSRN